ncbi:MAG: glycosyltransferase family 4 protein [Alphaproteobacteria bacterium]
MKILFINLSPLQFTVATPDYEPLGGSESSVCYLARQLAQNGHDIYLAARLPNNTPAHVMGITHIQVGTIQDKAFFTQHLFDVVIVCNMPIACPHVREYSPTSKIILWNHVLPNQPSMGELGNPLVQKTMDYIVYVSEHQKGATDKAFRVEAKARVIGNGLTPSFENLFSSAEELAAIKENRAAYTTTPFRGLNVLLKAMQGLKEETKLDIFSSMRVYQMPDHDYAALYEEAARDPRTYYHGAVSQKELAQKLKPAAFLTYPSIFEETFCLSALEAMAAGMKVITTNLGALPSTTMGYADLITIDTSSIDNFADQFRAVMQKNITAFKTDPKTWAKTMYEQVKAVNAQCTWSARAQDWEALFKSLT